MQVYQVPYNYEHEEKIFGGYISLRQAIYLIFTVSSLGIFLIPKIDKKLLSKIVSEIA